MAEKIEMSQGKDKLLWLLVFLVAVSSWAGNEFWLKLSNWPKMGYVSAAMILMLVFFTLTTQAKSLVEFYKEAKIELRKVIWPEKQETVRDTGRIIAVVLLVSVILWFIDRILFWFVSNLTYI